MPQMVQSALKIVKGTRDIHDTLYYTMKVSVYTSLFNYSPDKFDLLDAFKNWSKYANEIIIGTFEDQKKEIEEEVSYLLVNDLFKDKVLYDFWFGVRVISCSDTSLEDPLFDGKLKNAALQACSNELVIQQDMDERIGGGIEQWEYLCNSLKSYAPPMACMISVIDLYKDLDHYKGINSKWYLHLREGSYRGPVKFAFREDRTLDITKSDSCELIDKNGDLVPYVVDNRFSFDPLMNGGHVNIKYPHIIHLGYLDLEKRAEHNKFRKGCWEAMDGKPVEVATTVEKLEEENEAKPHGLKPEWWK